MSQAHEELVDRAMATWLSGRGWRVLPETDGEELLLAIVDETPIADLRAHFRARPQEGVYAMS